MNFVNETLLIGQFTRKTEMLKHQIKLLRLRFSIEREIFDEEGKQAEAEAEATHLAHPGHRAHSHPRRSGLPGRNRGQEDDGEGE